MQGILGTSLTNPIFYIQYREDNTIDIFFGFSKITNIPNDKTSLLFKSTIAMLLNAGVRAKHVVENFNISFLTAKKIAAAFNESKDEQDLLNNLRNPGRIPYKVNKEISEYIYERSEFYKSIGQCYFHQKIIDDVQKKFDITLSRETIRTELMVEDITISSEHVSSELSNNANFHDNKEMEHIENFSDNISFSKKMKFRNCYAGIFLLSSFLSLAFHDFPEMRTADGNYTIKVLFTWWMFAVLLGAKNFEQQRYMEIEDFEYITGHTGLPSVEKMRQILHELSLLDDTKISTFILKKNVDYFIEEDTDYYIDGHFKEYTGEADILQGWSTVKNRVSKGNIDYFVHDGCGNPIFSILLDNFYDFREVILNILSRLKKLRPVNEVMTLIYDRGGFSTELMSEISKGKGQYFITWQKGFKSKEAKDINFNGSIKIEYPYNDVGKLRGYKVEFGEDNWECKGFSCRRVFLKRETKNNKVIYQSVLTNDERTDAGIIIRKILKRFKQENDFKKQKNHFGLDEITSYAKLEYGTLNDKDPEKSAINKDYNEKLKEIKKLKMKREELFRKIGLEIFEESYLETLPIDFLQSNHRIIDEIKSLVIKIEWGKGELKQIDKKISKLQKCRDGRKIELDLRPKKIFSMVKVTGRNVFDKAARDFLETFGSLRDYQKVFRKLIRTGGEIDISDDIMYIKLDSFGRKKFREKCNRYFDKFNSQKIRTMDGKYILHFKSF